MFPEGGTKMEEYRKMITKSVLQIKSHVRILFEDCPITFDIPINDLISWGISFFDLKKEGGDTIFIKGRDGNRDEDLWGLKTILDMKKI